jgi:murein DD-endopeptidase MepM/ murein hydrolase activator NlpD
MSTMALRRAMGELFLTPLRGRLTSPYGYRRDPFTGVRTFHTGIDLAAPVGTPIKATLDGRIATTGYSAVYGNYVIVTHDGGYQSLYAHMHRIQVKRGQWVTQGGILGLVGNTGYSTGPHLHFSVYRNGKMVNPASLLN